MTTKQWLLVWTMTIIVLGIGFGAYHRNTIRDYEIEIQKLRSYSLDMEKRVAELETGHSINEQIRPATQHTKNLSVVLNRTILIDWVLRHSIKNKISKSIAAEIVDTSMSTSGGRFCLFLLALMQRESSFYIFNKSSAGALGLGQLMPDTIKEMIKRKVFSRRDDVFDPKKTIPAIIIWLKEKGMTNDGKNLEKALYGYLGANSKGYIRDIEANIGDLYLNLVREHTLSESKQSQAKAVSGITK